jgi:hypothetical protein
MKKVTHRFAACWRDVNYYWTMFRQLNAFIMLSILRDKEKVSGPI